MRSGVGPRTAVSSRVVRAGVAVLVLAALGSSSSAAGSTPEYRSWTYWHRTGGSWTFAQTGPASYQPADGSTEGWRYEVATGSTARPPATPPPFGTICAHTPARAGKIRVAVVLDYGSGADSRPGQHPPAARGACAQAPTGADAATLLATIATIRYRSDGLICAFDDYPTTGCVDIVTAAAPSPTATPRPTPRATPSPTPAARPTPIQTGRANPTRRATPTTRATTPAARRPTHPARTTAPASSRTVGHSTSPSASSSTSRPAPLPGSPVRPGSAPSGAGDPRAPSAAAASTAALVLTGSTRPGSGPPGALTWTAIAVLIGLASTAALLAVRRRRRTDTP